jgi:hypothetical protein
MRCKIFDTYVWFNVLSRNIPKRLGEGRATHEVNDSEQFLGENLLV